jgi:leucyl aminopeptidase
MDPIECDLDITFILEDSECADYSPIVKEAVAIGESLNYAKRLGDLPSNVCTPEYLSIRAQEDFRDLPVDVKVFGEVEAKQLKMEGFMSVSVGSDKEGQVITFDYRGGNKGDTEIVLVGKAVTFDSGGISIKPSSSMEEMKYDMCGGSTVFGVIKAAATMGLPRNIRGIVGAVENMPSGSATKPGDVIVMMSGKTVEVQNTDAEGRMVLADLLTYVGENYNADTVIDFATLTGACVSALGSHAAGVFTESDFLAEELYRSGIKTNDKCWRLPIWEEYNKQMDCDFADMGNAGKKGAGASTAACFLNRFASDYEYEYAHVDIAGVAWEKTATGRPIMMMLDYLKMRSQE